MITVKDCILPGVKYVASGFNWATVRGAQGQIVILTESLFDCWAIKQMLSLLAETNNKCRQLLKEHVFLVLGLAGTNSFCSKLLELVQEAAEIRVALDCDDAGRSEAKRIKIACKELEIPVTDCTNYPEFFEGKKDPNALLQNIFSPKFRLADTLTFFTGVDFT